MAQWRSIAPQRTSSLFHSFIQSFIQPFLFLPSFLQRVIEPLVHWVLRSRIHSIIFCAAASRALNLSGQFKLLASQEAFAHSLMHPATLNFHSACYRYPIYRPLTAHNFRPRTAGHYLVLRFQGPILSLAEANTTVQLQCEIWTFLHIAPDSDTNPL